MRKAIAWAVLLAALGGIGWLIYRKLTAPKADVGGMRRGGGAVAVELAPVQKATIRDIEKLTGTLNPRAAFFVAPKIAGRLEKLLVDVSDPVKPGQLIAVLDDAEYAEQVAQAKAELAVAKANAEQVRLGAALEDEELVQKAAQAQAELGIAKATVEDVRSTLEVTKREYERAQALRGKTILSESEFDATEGRYKEAKAKLEVALAQVAQKEAALRSAQVRLTDMQKNARAAEYQFAVSQVAQKDSALKTALVRLSYTQIKVSEGDDAQEPRVVGERLVDEGAMLKANDPILSVLDIRTMKALVHVTERDYAKLRVGQTVQVATDGVPGKAFSGRIVRIAPMLKESSRQGAVEIEVPNPERLLKPGMFIRTEIELERHADATVVPLNALVKRNGKQGVFVADKANQRASFVSFTPGLIEGDLVEVPQPPRALEGAEVVILGHHLLEDGGKILLPGGEPTGPPEKAPAAKPAAGAASAGKGSR